MDACVEIAFECLPLRTMGRRDVPLDLSPAMEALYHRIQAACERHGQHNSYYLHGGRCTFHLTNDPKIGMLSFRFEGTLLTDAEDLKTASADLEVALEEETCDWLVAPVVAWFQETVTRAVTVEFDRFIAAGDLKKTIERIRRVQAQSDAHGGYLGMGL